MANNIVQLQDKDGNNIFPISGGSESMPVGTEVSYDGTTVPAGWQEVDDPSVYSTEEQKIGTWVDGKPLYRKVFQATLTSGVTRADISTAGLNVAECISLKALAFKSQSDYELPYYWDTPEGWRCWFRPAANDIIIIFKANPAIITVNVIFEYTKTTD